MCPMWRYPEGSGGNLVTTLPSTASGSLLVFLWSQNKVYSTVGCGSAECTGVRGGVKVGGGGSVEISGISKDQYHPEIPWAGAVLVVLVLLPPPNWGRLSKCAIQRNRWGVVFPDATSDHLGAPMKEINWRKKELEGKSGTRWMNKHQNRENAYSWSCLAQQYQQERGSGQKWRCATASDGSLAQHYQSLHLRWGFFLSTHPTSLKVRTNNIHNKQQHSNNIPLSWGLVLSYWWCVWRCLVLP